MYTPPGALALWARCAAQLAQSVQADGVGDTDGEADGVGETDGATDGDVDGGAVLGLVVGACVRLLTAALISARTAATSLVSVIAIADALLESWPRSDATSLESVPTICDMESYLVGGEAAQRQHAI
mgnify:CR=1 FL=1